LALLHASSCDNQVCAGGYQLCRCVTATYPATNYEQDVSEKLLDQRHHASRHGGVCT